MKTTEMPGRVCDLHEDKDSLAIAVCLMRVCLPQQCAGDESGIAAIDEQATAKWVAACAACRDGLVTRSGSAEVQNEFPGLGFEVIALC